MFSIVGVWLVLESLVRLSLAACRMCVTTCLKEVGITSINIFSIASAGVGGMGHCVISVSVPVSLYI